MKIWRVDGSRAKVVIMSLRTRVVAVAVKHMMGVDGKVLRK